VGVQNTGGLYLGVRAPWCLGLLMIEKAPLAVNTTLTCVVIVHIQHCRLEPQVVSAMPATAGSMGTGVETTERAAWQGERGGWMQLSTALPLSLFSSLPLRKRVHAQL